MKQSPLVSVIVTNYNYAKYVGQCIESAINQTYKPIEIVVINDGSTDNSDQVIKKYTNKHPEIKYINQKNQGANVIRNKGIRLAKGDYIFLLDADNWLNPDHIEKLVKKAKETNADVVYSDLQHFGDDNELFITPEFNLLILKTRNFIDTGSLIKKTSIEDSEFDTNLNRKFLQDYDFFLGLALKGLKIVKAQGTRLNYRVHEMQGGGNKNTAEKQSQFLEIYKYITDKYTDLYPDQFDSITRFTKDIFLEKEKMHRDVLELRQKLVDLKEENSKLKEQISAIMQSSSWRITKPLRELRSIVKKNI